MNNRHRYPRNWSQLAQACKDRARWRCEKCGVKHRTIRRSRWTGKEWPVFLQAAHQNHDPENPHPELICVCPSCHWHYFRRPGIRPGWLIEKIKHRKLIDQAYIA